MEVIIGVPQTDTRGEDWLSRGHSGTGRDERGRDQTVSGTALRVASGARWLVFSYWRKGTRPGKSFRRTSRSCNGGRGWLPDTG